MEKIYCLCVLIALSACSGEKPPDSQNSGVKAPSLNLLVNTHVRKKQILDFLKVEFQYDGFKHLECVGNNPLFKLLENPKPQREVVWQREVSPEAAALTFRAILNIDNQDKLIVGHLNVKAWHAQYWLSEGDYISFSISMNEWYFVKSGDDIDKYCD